MRTLVVSWNDAAEMKLSVESDALVIPEEEWGAVGGLAAAVHHFLVLFHEAEAIDLLPVRVIAEEIRIADSRHAHGAQHLTADDFDGTSTRRQQNRLTSPLLFVAQRLELPA